MEERIARLGGAFGIHSELGGGAILTVQLPAAVPAATEYQREPDSNPVSR
jgi:hypothetical protein